MLCFFLSQEYAMFSLEMNDARPMNLILTSSVLSYATFNLNKDVNLYVSSLFYSIVFLVVPRASCSEPLREPRSFPSLCEAVVWILFLLSAP